MMFAHFSFPLSPHFHDDYLFIHLLSLHLHSNVGLHFGDDLGIMNARMDQKILYPALAGQFSPIIQPSSSRGFSYLVRKESDFSSKRNTFTGEGGKENSSKINAHRCCLERETNSPSLHRITQYRFFSSLLEACQRK